MMSGLYRYAVFCNGFQNFVIRTFISILCKISKTIELSIVVVINNG